MIGRLRRRRLLAPVLIGSLLTGGCHLFGPEPGADPPPGTVKDKTLRQDVQPGPGSVGGTKQDPAPDRRPAGTVPPADRVRDVPPTVLESQGKEATTVSYIPPAGVPSPYSPIAGASGPAGVPLPPDPARRNESAGAGREIEMTMKYNGGGEGKSLEARMQQLEQRLEQRDRAVRQSGAEVQAATEELQRARTQLATLRKDADDTRARMRDRDRENNEALRAYVKVLEQLVGEDAPPEGATKPVLMKGP